MRNITHFTLLVGGYFNNISVFTFDPASTAPGPVANSTFPTPLPAGNSTLPSTLPAGNSTLPSPLPPAANVSGLKLASVVAHPANPTWFETECGLFAAAESAANVVTRLSLQNGTLKVLEQVTVGGDPVHLTTTPDCSGLISSSYSNGTISYIPLLRETGANATLPTTNATTVPSNGSAAPAVPAAPAASNGSALAGALAAGTAEGRSFGQAVTLRFNATYPNGTAPQDQSRAHASLVHGGKIYTADLGSDRIWISRWANGSLKLEGSIETPKGFGPRHMVVLQPDETPAAPSLSNASSASPIATPATVPSAAVNGSAAGASKATPLAPRASTTLVTPGTNATKPRSAILYVVGELANNVTAFELDAPQKPLFQESVIPAGLNSTGMAAGEIMVNPRNSSQLFVSNRLAAKSNANVTGDAISILTLSQDRRAVAGKKFVTTQLNNIRGMKFSPTGDFLALAGVEKGIAVFAEKAGNWTQVAKYDNIQQAADFAWIEGDSYSAQ